MISGEKIFLRALEPDDVKKLYNWENDTNYWQISNTLIPYSKYLLYEFIAKVSNDIIIDKQLRLIICNKTNNEAIGTLDLFEFDPIHRRIGIGILIDQNFRRNGVAFEAINLAIDYAFNTLNLHQIYCNIFEDNLESLNLFDKCGFIESGLKKDWILNSGTWKNIIFMQLINNKS